MDFVILFEQLHLDLIRGDECIGALTTVKWALLSVHERILPGQFALGYPRLKHVENMELGASQKSQVFFVTLANPNVIWTLFFCKMMDQNYTGVQFSMPVSYACFTRYMHFVFPVSAQALYFITELVFIGYRSSNFKYRNFPFLRFSLSA